MLGAVLTTGVGSGVGTTSFKSEPQAVSAKPKLSTMMLLLNVFILFNIFIFHP
jgi:hypothetical protein